MMGEDRKEDRRCRGSKVSPCAQPNQDQHWVVERRNQRISWWMDGHLVMHYLDQNPINQSGFAFNNWSAPVSFDNLEIYQLIL